MLLKKLPEKKAFKKMAQKYNVIPVCTQMRTIFYDNSIGGKRAVEERLRKYLQNILTNTQPGA